MRLSKLLRSKFIRFCIVGGSGAVLSLLLMYIGVDILEIHYMVNYFMVFMIVVAFNYVLNKSWTFYEYKSSGIVSFYIGRIGTLIINECILYLMVSILDIQYLMSTIVAISISMMLNYKYSRSKVWKNLKAT